MLNLSGPSPARPERRRPRGPGTSQAAFPIRKPATENLPRRLGDYLLTSELSEDALGHVYRAIDVRGNGEFVRLRAFDSPDLDRASLLAGMEEDRALRSFIVGPWTVRAERAVEADGVPCLAWTEAHGWTLDQLLAGFRELGEALEPDHAFLVTDRIAAALEFAHRTRPADHPIVHGLVWPGFVAVGADGDVRLAGFGLARGLAPSLRAPRVAREIATHLAPEARQGFLFTEQGDVYAVGAILLALLTARSATAEPARAVLRQEDRFPPQVARLLRLALAPTGIRFATMSEFRRELGNILVEGIYASSSLRFSELLARRLEPQSVQYAGPGRPPDVLSEGPADEDAEVDSVLRDYWSRAETT